MYQITSSQLLAAVTLGGGLIFLVLRHLFRQVTVILARRKLIQQYNCRPPNAYPHKDPFLGLDLIRDALRAGKSKRYLSLVRGHYQKFGNTFSSRFWTSPVINTIEPENIKAILATNFNDYVLGSRRTNAFAPILGNSIFQVDGVKWENSRALLRPSFARSQVSDLEMLDGHVNNLIQEIESTGKGSTVDLAEPFLRLSADVSTELLFGESIHSLEITDSLQARFVKALEDSQHGCGLRWRLGGFSKILVMRKFNQSVKVVHEYIHQHVDKAIQFRKSSSSMQTGQSSKDTATKKDRYIFSHELSKKTQNRDVLRDELLALFFAGTGTTASLLSNFFFVAARRPDIWQRIRAEANALTAGEKPTLEQLKKMEYVQFCLKESLRLHAVVPTTTRIAGKDTILPVGGGPDGKSPVLVRVGTMMLFPVTALHQRKDLWGQDAHEFRPERWNNEKTSWKYLPFSGGPRICIGQELALNMALYTTVRLAQHFSAIESRDPVPEWVEGLSVTCTSANGVQVALTPGLCGIEGGKD